MGWKEEKSGMGGKWEEEMGGEGWGIGRSREKEEACTPRYEILDKHWRIPRSPLNGF